MSEILSKGSCSKIFTAALFVEVGNSNQLKCLIIGILNSKLWYIYAMEYYELIYKGFLKNI